MIDPTTAFDFLLLPGLGNSGVDHWQSHWSMAFPNASRVLQDDWDRPLRDDWLRRLDRNVADGQRPAILIGHSLGTALAVHWLASHAPGRVKAALLVAPSDVESSSHTPDEVRDFAPLPQARLPVPAIVVASNNDPYVDSAGPKPSRTHGARRFTTLGNSVTLTPHRGSDSGRRAC